MTMTSSISRIRFIIQQSESWKKRFLKGRIALYILTFMMVFALSITLGYFNLFYYFLSVLKYVISFSFFIATVYFMVADKETSENWQNRTVRNKDILGKLLLSIIEGAIFLAISTAILGIFYLTGFPYKIEQTYLAEHTGASPLRYVPTAVEAIIYSFIILMMLISLITSIYWYYSRCVKVIGFRKREKVMKINIVRAIIGFLANFALWQ